LIDGMMYELERNQDGRIHLHSGAQATHRRMWELVAQSDNSATLRCALLDGACGLPGNRVITATFTLTPPATLTLTIEGVTDAPTLMNMANHSYWNFDGSDTWGGHKLWIDADAYLPCDVDNCPTGEVAPVDGTKMDFRTAQHISPQDHVFDNNFCLSDGPKPLRDVLRLTGQSGVGMTLATDQPGLQIYDGRSPHRPGRTHYEGLAIEAQGWPDAPTHRHFPSIAVTPDTPYHQTTQFRFHSET